MIVKTLDIRQSEFFYSQLIENDFSPCFELNDDYQKLRDLLLQSWNKNKENVKNIKKYSFDLSIAIDVYSIFANQFDEVTLADYDFWRYISICVIPDLLYERWGNSNKHFYKKTVRIYPFTLFWYIKLSWQGTLENTYNLLNTSNCTTDTILQCVERPGKMGVNVEYFNTLMKLFCEDSTIEEQSNIDLFRRILVLNTARSVNVIAELYKNGMNGYVQDLLETAKGGISNGKQD